MNSLVVQWLGLRASTAGGTGSIPDWETKILRAMQQCGQKKKRDQYHMTDLPSATGSSVAQQGVFIDPVFI